MKKMFGILILIFSINSYGCGGSVKPDIKKVVLKSIPKYIRVLEETELESIKVKATINIDKKGLVSHAKITSIDSKVVNRAKVLKVIKQAKYKNGPIESLDQEYEFELMSAGF